MFIAGDFSNIGTQKEIRAFESYVAKLPFSHKVVIAGNHDITLDTNYYIKRGKSRFHRRGSEDHIKCQAILRESKNLHYLQDSGVNILGLDFWGSPWQPEFCDWAFNCERGKEIQEKWDLIPTGTDVLITHGPPGGKHGGICDHGLDAGCVDLLNTVEKIKPIVHIFGHIHEDYGVTEDNGTIFANASTCTLSYRPLNPPIVIDVRIDIE